MSWNHFHDHSKTTLVGHSDTYTADIGKLKVTYHHNFFDGTDQRHPRVRFGEPVHVFNNYYREQRALRRSRRTDERRRAGRGQLLRERGATRSTSATTRAGPGRVVERNNRYVNSGTPQTAGSVVEPRTYYPYTVDDPATLPTTVPAGVGVGKL